MLQIECSSTARQSASLADVAAAKQQQSEPVLAATRVAVNIAETQDAHSQSFHAAAAAVPHPASITTRFSCANKAHTHCYTGGTVHTQVALYEERSVGAR